MDTADPAIPAAQEVIIDLPSALHVSRYQLGEVNGLRYILYPDGSGKVMQTTGQRAVLHRMECPSRLACVITGPDGSRETRTRPAGPEVDLPDAPDGTVLINYLTDWVLHSNPRSQPPQQPAQTGLATLETQAKAIEATKEMPAVSSSARQPEALAATQPSYPTAQPAAPLAQLHTAVTPRQARKKPAPHKTRTPAEPRVVGASVTPKPAPVPPPKRPTLIERLNLSCAITGSVTLRYTNSAGARKFGKPRTSLSCGARLSEKLTLRVSAIGYLDSAAKSASDAEFTYALSYRPTDKLTFSYSNYSGRISDSSNAFLDSLSSGTLRASYRLPKIKLRNGKTVSCFAGIGLAKPEDNRANLTCSYAPTKKIRIGASAYAYFPDAQSSTDADFSYTASYRINENWSVNYNNYTNNRFFWNKSSNPGQGILGGSLSVTYRFKF